MVKEKYAVIVTRPFKGRVLVGYMTIEREENETLSADQLIESARARFHLENDKNLFIQEEII